MEITFSISGYRCFSEDHPAEFTLGDGTTAIVGVNNSGKSSLLKFFYELRPLFQLLASPGTEFLAALNGPRPFNLSEPTQYQDIFNVHIPSNIVISMSVVSGEMGGAGFTPYAEESHVVAEKLVIKILKDQNVFKVEAAIAEAPGRLLGSGNFENGLLKVPAIEMPLYLGHFFDAFSKLANTFYIGPFRNILDVTTEGKTYFDMHVGRSFIERLGDNKTGTNRNTTQMFLQLTEDLARIFKIDRLEINSANDKRDIQFIINGKSFRSAEIGSGITQFLVILGNLIQAKKAFILIDEPELNLHPALQADFISVLSSYASTGVFFATHNIGLAREMGDRVYSIRRISEGPQITELGETRLSEFLGELGFAAYRELGYEKLLLVEGVGELKAIRELLYKYGNLNSKCVMIHLGGSNLINAKSEEELSEILRICDDVTVLIDSERTSAGGPPQNGREEFRRMCSDLGMKVHMLERRALENYFPDHAVKAAFGHKHAALGPFDADPTWKKRQNWQITKLMEAKDLDGTDLGAFLKSL